jgi:apolipoprotein N-acyltransferase
MPFGEFVPGENWIPGMSWLFDMADEIHSGPEATVLQTSTGARLGVMLCYEDMLPEAARSTVDRSANLLVSLINASAFDNPLTLTQHRQLAQLRAVECRRAFLRCSATGETCVISPLGTIDATLPLQAPGVLTASVPLVDAPLYPQNLATAFNVACAVGLVCYWLGRRRRRAPG